MNRNIEPNEMKLVTLEQWLKYVPHSQGFVLYMQEELPGSELKGLTNPYKKGTRKHEEFEDGIRCAVLEVQDIEE